MDDMAQVAVTHRNFELAIWLLHFELQVPLQAEKGRRNDQGAAGRAARPTMATRMLICLALISALPALVDSFPCSFPSLAVEPPNISQVRIPLLQWDGGRLE